MKKFLKPFFGILVLIALLILPFFVFADSEMPEVIVDSDEESAFEENSVNKSPLQKLEKIGQESGYSTDRSLPAVAGSIVNVALSLLGIIFVILIIVGGFKWMTAGGNENDVATATKYIKNSVIGLIVILSSWAIWEFIIQRLL